MQISLPSIPALHADARAAPVFQKDSNMNNSARRRRDGIAFAQIKALLLKETRIDLILIISKRLRFGAKISARPDVLIRGRTRFLPVVFVLVLIVFRYDDLAVGGSSGAFHEGGFPKMSLEYGSLASKYAKETCFKKRKGTS